MTQDENAIDHYGAQYSQFATDLYRRIRAEAFGEDIGQNGWLTASEQDLFLSRLGLRAGDLLLDVACGSGGPTLRIAKQVGCRVHGVDLHEQGIAEAQAQAAAAGLQDRAQFTQLDAAKRLPMVDGSVDGVMCVDAVNHLPDRRQVLKDWVRVLRRGGRLLFTDPIVVTGPLTNEEIAIRSSIGFFLFVPPGVNEQLLEDVGFQVEEVIDRTANMAQMAERWRRARERYAAAVRQAEGPDTFEGQQRFFEVAARIAGERRLSRFAYCATRT